MKSIQTLLKNLQLEILLKGKDFDGNLNFGAVILENNGKKYPLDITDTQGFKGEDIAGIGDFEYLLVCKFEDDYLETKSLFKEFSVGYYFNLTSEILSDTDTQGVTNLYLIDETELSSKNIERVISMVVTSTLDTSINIPIKQNLSV